uniref:Uncharacterized protein n=1 Tax=Timema tahoe TaxID=61484 RepID=A0A7R9FJG7_9NEOP|nr:unnamed protein product [Timema tahoe]
MLMAVRQASTSDTFTPFTTGTGCILNVITSIVHTPTDPTRDTFTPFITGTGCILNVITSIVHTPTDPTRDTFTPFITGTGCILNVITSIVHTPTDPTRDTFTPFITGTGCILNVITSIVHTPTDPTRDTFTPFITGTGCILNVITSIVHTPTDPTRDTFTPFITGTGCILNVITSIVHTPTDPTRDTFTPFITGTGCILNVITSIVHTPTDPTRDTFTPFITGTGCILNVITSIVHTPTDPTRDTFTPFITGTGCILNVITSIVHTPTDPTRDTFTPFITGTGCILNVITSIVHTPTDPTRDTFTPFITGTGCILNVITSIVHTPTDPTRDTFTPFITGTGCILNVITSIVHTPTDPTRDTFTPFITGTGCILNVITSIVHTPTDPTRDTFTPFITGTGCILNVITSIVHTPTDPTRDTFTPFITGTGCILNVITSIVHTPTDPTRDTFTPFITGTGCILNVITSIVHTPTDPTRDTFTPFITGTGCILNVITSIVHTPTDPTRDTFTPFITGTGCILNVITSIVHTPTDPTSDTFTPFITGTGCLLDVITSIVHTPTDPTSDTFTTFITETGYLLDVITSIVHTSPTFIFVRAIKDVLRVNIRERDGEERVPKHLFLIAFLDANTACPVPLYHGALYKWRNYPAFHTTSSTSTPSPPSRHPSRSPKTPLSLSLSSLSLFPPLPIVPRLPQPQARHHGVYLWRAFSSSGLRLHVFPLDTRAHACAEALENNRAVRAGIIVAAECPYSQQLLQRNDGSGYFGGSSLSPRGQGLLRGLHVFPNSDVTWVQRVSGVHVEFLEVHRATMSTSLIVTGIGTTRTGGEHIILKLAGNSGKTRTRSDLRGGVLKADTIMAASGCSQSCTTPFDGTGFTNWEFRMRLLLEKNGVLYVLVDDPPEEKDTLQNFKDDNVKASNIMVNRGIANNLLTIIMGENTAKDIMEALRSTYEKKGMKSLVNAQRNWRKMEYQHDKPLQEFFQEFEAARADVTIAGKRWMKILYPEQFKDMYDLTMRHVDTWTKINYPLVEYLAASMNFSLIVVYSNSYGWQTNGSFDGLMGLLQRFEVDITASGIFMRLDRMEVSHFVAETFPVKTAIIFRQPSLSSHNIASKSFSLRTTSFVFSLTTLFLYTAYSANIVALLQTPYTSIRDLRDLVESPLAVGIQDVEYNHVYLTESLDPVIMNLVKNKLSDKKGNQYFSPEKGIERVQHGMFAFQVDKALAYKLISDTFTERDKCGLMEVELFPLPLMSLATVRGSPYKEFIAQRVRWFREVGILDRIWKLWVSQRPVCEDKMKEFVSVGRMELYPAMQVFRIGAVVSVAVLMAELIHFHRPQRTPGEILKLRLSHPGDDSSEQTVEHRHDKKLFPGEGVVASQFELVYIYLRGTSRWRTSLEGSGASKVNYWEHLPPPKFSLTPQPPYQNRY